MHSVGRVALVVPFLVVASANCDSGARVDGGSSGVKSSADAKTNANAQTNAAPHAPLPPSPLGDADAKEGCAAVADAMCKKLASCSPNIAEANGDLATCIDANKRLCAVDFQLPGVVASKAELLACGKRITDSSCDSTVFGFAQCGMKGVVATGGGCAIDEQCKSGMCASKGGCGKCVDKVAVGGACSDDNVCPPDAPCTDGKCAPVAKVGQACKVHLLSSIPRCAAGSACGEKSNKCEAAGALGQHRSDTGLPCRGKNVASFMDECVPLMAPSPPGGACGSVKDGLAICKVGSCTAGNKCVASVAEGAACDPVKGVNCASPFGCHAGKCRLVAADDPELKKCF